MLDPYSVVPNQDWCIRFCIDFQKVKAVSGFNAYPMPRADKLLEKLGATWLITTCDLTMVYWQISLIPKFQIKTAFYIQFGLH